MTNYEWMQRRLCRFTASEIHKLFVGGSRKMTAEELKEAKENKSKRTTVDTLFGEGAETYIRMKAAEFLTCEVKEEIDFKQAEWGKAWEPVARREFEAQHLMSGDYYGNENPTFFEYGEYAGVSPDWEGFESGADFKCPYNSHIHLENLLIKDQEEFKAKRWEYYCQAQMGMVVRGWKVFYFVSYDPRIVETQYQMKVLEIYPDEAWREEFEVRLNAAIERVKEILNQLEQPAVA